MNIWPQRARISTQAALSTIHSRSNRILKLRPLLPSDNGWFPPSSQLAKKPIWKPTECSLLKSEAMYGGSTYHCPRKSKDSLWNDFLGCVFCRLINAQQLVRFLSIIERLLRISIVTQESHNSHSTLLMITVITGEQSENLTTATQNCLPILVVTTENKKSCEFLASEYEYLELILSNYCEYWVIIQFIEWLLRFTQ